MSNQPTENFLNYIENRWQWRNSHLPLPKGASARIWLLGVEEGADHNPAAEIEGSNSLREEVYGTPEGYREGLEAMHIKGDYRKTYGRDLWHVYKGFVGNDDLSYEDFVDTMCKQYLLWGNLYPAPLTRGNDKEDQQLWNSYGLPEVTGVDSVKAYKEHMDQRDDYRKLAADTAPQLIVCHGWGERRSFARRLGVRPNDMHHEDIKVGGETTPYIRGTINDGKTALCITRHFTASATHDYFLKVGQELHKVYNS